MMDIVPDRPPLVDVQDLSSSASGLAGHCKQRPRRGAGFLKDLLGGRGIGRVPAQAQRGAYLNGTIKAVGREIELAMGQSSNVVRRSTFGGHQLLGSLDGRGRTHATVNMSGAVRYNRIINSFGKLGREDHAQSVFARLRDE